MYVCIYIYIEREREREIHNTSQTNNAAHNLIQTSNIQSVMSTLLAM